MFQRLLSAATVTGGLYLYLLLTGVFGDSISFNNVSLPLLAEILGSSELAPPSRPDQTKEVKDNLINFFPTYY